jgi:hypothetical protein
MRETKICPQCGSDDVGRSNRFCSQDCYNIYTYGTDTTASVEERTRRQTGARKLNLLALKLDRARSELALAEERYQEARTEFGEEGAAKLDTARREYTEHAVESAASLTEQRAQSFVKYYESEVGRLVDRYSISHGLDQYDADAIVAHMKGADRPDPVEYTVEREVSPVDWFGDV